MRKKVLCAISGGIDSSVAAYLLQKNGYEVTGITMDFANKDSEDHSIENEKDQMFLAQQICDILKIEHITVNYHQELQNKVIKNFISEYQKGRTPNPCVICNKYLKFGMLANKVTELGYDYFATGHYVGKVLKNNKYFLKRPIDRKKDQTYFLYGIKPEVLNLVLFPLADLTKDQVREIAVERGFPAAEKKESQDICFIKDNNIKNFLKKSIKEIKEGPIVNLDGEEIGRHSGLIYYTIGQRGGMGISHPKPLYVYSIEPETNTLIAAEKEFLKSKGLIANNLNLFDQDILKEKIKAKIRYAHPEADCKVLVEKNQMHIEFLEPQNAITKGQSVVLYHDNLVIGGGIIQKVKR